jgi:dihydroorotate dehydrogenase (NAD+) catalytic subunit
VTAAKRGAFAGTLAVEACGLTFRNPIVLAAGTAGYGRELSEVMDLARLGGIVTKAVSLEPRAGAPAPRVAEFPGGMINAVGLANPGLEAVRSAHLPWMARHLPGTRKIVNVVGFTAQEFAAVIEGLERAAPPGTAAGEAVDAYELNVSCPNVKQGGVEFGSDPGALREVIAGARAATRRPLFVKLSPALPDIAATARLAVDAGADALTLVNTLPGLLVEPATRRPILGFGTGGVSGAALLPIGLLAVRNARRAVPVPICGLGGVSSVRDVVAYCLAGATLVGVGTAALRDPRVPERLARELGRWCDRLGARTVRDLVGTMDASPA